MFGELLLLCCSMFSHESNFQRPLSGPEARASRAVEHSRVWGVPGKEGVVQLHDVCHQGHMFEAEVIVLLAGNKEKLGL